MSIFLIFFWIIYLAIRKEMSKPAKKPSKSRVKSAVKSTDTLPPWTPSNQINDPEHTIVYGEEVQYCLVEHLLARDTQAHLTKAYMGVGKTVASIKLADTLPPDARVLAISPRQSYALTACAEFNKRCEGDDFECYLTVKGSLSKCKRLFIQFESLHRLVVEGRVLPFDLVIADEIESILVQSVSAETNKERIVANQRIFANLLQSSGRCLFLDAFMSMRTLGFVQSLGIRYTYHHYLRMPVVRNAISYNSGVIGKPYTKELAEHDLNHLLSELISLLKLGNHYYMFVSSKNMLDRIVLAVEKALPEKKIVQYHRDSTEPLNDIANHWLVDLVITTCSITVGCNFDHPTHFQGVFVYVSSVCQNLISDVFQSHMRVRHLTDNEMHYLVDPRAYSTEPFKTREQITTAYERRVGYLPTLSSNLADVSDHWYQVDIDVLTARNHSTSRTIEMFNWYLKECNYTNSQAHVEEDVDDVLEDSDEIDPIPYKDIPELRYSEYQFLYAKKQKRGADVERLTDLENASLAKYNFDTSLRENLPIERRAVIWDVYREIGKSVYYQLRTELGLATGKITVAEIMDASPLNVWNSGFRLRLMTVESIVKMLGLKNTLEAQSISRKDFVEMMKHPQYLDLEKYGLEAFKIRSQRSEDSKDEIDIKRVAEFVGGCLKAWSGATFGLDKRKQKMVNGVRYDINGLTLKPVEAGFIKDVIPCGKKEDDRNRVKEWGAKRDFELDDKEMVKGLKKRDGGGSAGDQFK